MDYIYRILQDDEHILARAKPHWTVIGLPFSVVFLLLGLLQAVDNKDLSGLGTIWVGIAVIWVAGGVIAYLISELGVTDRRVIGRVGIFDTVVCDLPHEKIREIRVDRPRFGRIFGYASILLVTVDGETFRFKGIAGADAFAGAAREAVDAAKTTEAGTNDPNAEG